MHFEKGSYLQAVGNSVLPTYDPAETIDRLAKVIEIYSPDHVVALGDSFHDTKAGDRLEQKNFEALNTIISDLSQFTWILGNHDPSIPSGLEGEQEDHLEIDGFLLTHLPVVADEGQTNICGHLHPKAKIDLKKRRISCPCLACSDTRIILPPFGAYTGGLFVTHEEIQNTMGEIKSTL